MIWLAQLLCPKRHCIIAVPFELHDLWEPKRKQVEEGVFKDGALNWRCGICGSTELLWCLQMAPFESLAAAMPMLKKCERDQIETRAWMDVEGLTKDSQTHKDN